MKYGGSVYIMTNTVLYTGVTSDLKKRTLQHKNKEFKTGFTANYNGDRLVYFESFLRIEEAIARQKQIKGGSRKQKEELIASLNRGWKDLWEDIQNW